MRLLACVLFYLWSILAYAHDVELIPVHKPDPVYPKEFQDVDISGTAQVYLVVKHDGTVKHTEVLESSHAELAESALRAVSSWRFKPWTLEEGRPSEVEAVAPVKFYMDKSSENKRR